jgi:hypothetical protein
LSDTKSDVIIVCKSENILLPLAKIRIYKVRNIHIIIRKVIIYFVLRLKSLCESEYMGIEMAKNIIDEKNIALFNTYSIEYSTVLKSDILIKYSFTVSMPSSKYPYPTIEIAPIVIISITNTIDLALIPSNTIIPSRNTGMSHRK